MIRGAAKNNNAVGTYRMHCTIANVGQGAAPNFWVKWWVNDKMVTRGVVGALQPKTSTDRFDGNVCDYKLQPKDKKLRVLVIIDPDNQVPQENILNDWANAEFELILRVGAGNPSGVPRPVVNSTIVAPAATNAVDEMPSFPGASSNVRPGLLERSA